MTLTELLVSLGLSAIILSTSLAMYVNMMGNQVRMQQQMHHLIDERLAFDLITDAIKQAGFLPCGRVAAFAFFNHRTGQRETIPSINITSKQLRVVSMGLPFLEAQIIDKHTLAINDHLSLNKTYPIIITNCTQHDVNYISAIRPTTKGLTITLAYPLSISAKKGIYIGPWQDATLMVKNHQLIYKAARAETLIDNLTALSFHHPDKQSIRWCWQAQGRPLLCHYQRIAHATR